MSHLEQEQLLFTPTAANFGSNFIRLANIIILQGFKVFAIQPTSLSKMFIPKWAKVILNLYAHYRIDLKIVISVFTVL